MVYGGKLRRGVRPNHFQTGSGAVIRKALQTLEALKWVEKHSDGKGRVLSKQVSAYESILQCRKGIHNLLQGRKDLDRIATELRKTQRPVVDIANL